MTEQSTTLQLWIDRFRADDPAALNELYRHSEARLRLLTRQMLARYPRVHDWEQTSDVFMGAMTRLFAALRDVSVKERLRTPLDLLRLSATLIRRELIDLARGIHRLGLPPAGGETVPDVPGRDKDDPYRIAAWQELHQRIDEKLAADDRELWNLLYYQGLTQVEAVALLGVPEKTLKRRWMKLKKNLVEELGGDWPLDER